MKIIIFPFAGGSEYSFNYLNKIDSKDISFETVIYSGRGSKIGEPLRYNIHEIVEDVYNHLLPIINSQKYIIYGHSMGALVGFLFCKKCLNHGMNLPEMLIVSGCKAPSRINKKKISNLESSLFWGEVKKYGGIPDGVLNDEEIKDFFESILKADFNCIEEYEYSENNKLNIPINVFYGSDEDIIQEEVEEWQKETTNNVNITKLKGNHFFIFDHTEFFIEYFKNLWPNAIF